MVVVRRSLHRLATRCRRLADWLDAWAGRSTERVFRGDQVVLSEADYQVLAGEFQRHAEAVQAQVSRYADTLAGDDPVLRQRLRRFEGGATS